MFRDFTEDHFQYPCVAIVRYREDWSYPSRRVRRQARGIRGLRGPLASMLAMRWKVIMVQKPLHPPRGSPAGWAVYPSWQGRLLGNASARRRALSDFFGTVSGWSICDTEKNV